MFKHAITQDVAYQALLKARRKQLHRKVGFAFETLFFDRLAELASTLAYHFERAEQHDKAFHYCKQAGEHAQSIFANAEAAEVFRAAIFQANVLLEQGENGHAAVNLAAVHESLGDVLHLSGQGEAARRVMIRFPSWFRLVIA